MLKVTKRLVRKYFRFGIILIALASCVAYCRYLVGFSGYEFRRVKEVPIVVVALAVPTPDGDEEPWERSISKDVDTLPKEAGAITYIDFEVVNFMEDRQSTKVQAYELEFTFSKDVPYELELIPAENINDIDNQTLKQQVLKEQDESFVTIGKGHLPNVEEATHLYTLVIRCNEGATEFIGDSTDTMTLTVHAKEE